MQLGMLFPGWKILTGTRRSDGGLKEPGPKVLQGIKWEPGPPGPDNGIYSPAHAGG